MESLKLLNLSLAFILELIAVGAFAYFGFHLNQPTVVKILIGVGLPILVITAWAVWAAPASTNRLHIPWLLVFKAVIFTGGALALHASGKTSWSLGLFLFFICNEALALLWGQEQPANHR